MSGITEAANWLWLHNEIIDPYGAQIGTYGVAVYVVLCRCVGKDQQTWIG